MTTAPVLSVSSQRPTGAGTRTWKALAVVAASLTALVIPAAHADEFNTVLSAGIGAAAGAVIGHSIGGHRGALIGAGTGGLIGASVAQQ
ncbi:MAG: YMGG-like glycine zipper-containing protein, partial [Rhodoferax sp.]